MSQSSSSSAVFRQGNLSAKKPYCEIFVFEGNCNVVAFSVFKYLCIF